MFSSHPLISALSSSSGFDHICPSSALLYSKDTHSTHISSILHHWYPLLLWLLAPTPDPAWLGAWFSWFFTASFPVSASVLAQPRSDLIFIVFKLLLFPKQRRCHLFVSSKIVMDVGHILNNLCQQENELCHKGTDRERLGYNTQFLASGINVWIY